MLIFSPSTYELVEKNCSVKTADKLLIPVVYGFMCEKPRSQWSMTDSQLSTADQTGVHIRVSFVSDDLKAMAIYLENLYFWFLVGPVITLEWLRRKKILCCSTTARQIDEESGNEEMVEEGRGHYIQRALIFTYHAQISATGFLGCSSTKRQLFDILFHEWRFDISNSHYMVVSYTSIFLFYV